ncbi:MAG: hypothetical protein Q8R28_05060, partial [Dehalococcoidia bacterium]|nr:hypothetical protein [Dehalococcoidia bacterium]
MKGGAGKGQAAVSGAISGVAELAFSKLVGDAKVAKAIKELTQGTAKSTPEALKFLAGTGNREGIDELLTTVSQRLGQGFTYKDTFIGQEDIKPILESYAAGFAIGGMAPAPKLARLARAGFKSQTPGGVEIDGEAEPVTGPGIAPDDALSQVRELQNQALGAKLAQEQHTFDAIMRPLSQDDSDAMREYEILEQEEGRLKGQIGSVQGQEDDATKLYSELEEEGKWGLSKDTVNSILRGQDPKAKLIGDMVKMSDPTEDQLTSFAERVKALEVENPAVANAVAEMIVSDGVTKEVVNAVEALKIKGAEALMGEDASKTRFLSKDAEAEQLAAMSESVADSAIEQLGGNVTAESIRADTEFAELAGMNLLQAQEALAQMRQAQHEADMLLSGDPSRLDSPQAFAAQRVELENQLQDLYARREALKATMAESRQEALSGMESGVAPGSAVERLRAKALEISGKSGDFGYFDQFDIEARRMGRNPAVPLFNPPTDPRPRTLAEAASEYRDAMYAVLPKMEKRLNAKYDEMRKDNKIPRNEIGELMTREEFVLQETNTAIQQSNAKLQELLQLNSGKPGGEDVRALDAEMLAVLKRYRVKPEDVGFRGDLAMMRQGIADAGAEWLGGRIPAGKAFSELEAGELVNLAQEART